MAKNNGCDWRKNIARLMMAVIVVVSALSWGYAVRGSSDHHHYEQHGQASTAYPYESGGVIIGNADYSAELTAEFTRLLVVGTFGLCAIALGQFALFWWQLRLIREGASDTKEAAETARKGAIAAEKSADAALLNATAVIHAERPHLLVEKDVELLGFRYSKEEWEELGKIYGCSAAAQSRFVRVRYKIKNYGKTPAWIVGLDTKLELSPWPILTDNPQYSDVTRDDIPYVVAPGEVVSSMEFLTDGPLNERDWVAVCGGEKIIFFHGKIRFSAKFSVFDGGDVAGKLESGFAFKFHVGGGLRAEGFQPSRPPFYWEYR